MAVMGRTRFPDSVQLMNNTYSQELFRELSAKSLYIWLIEKVMEIATRNRIVKRMMKESAKRRRRCRR